MKKGWRIDPANPPLQQSLSDALNISAVTAQVLINRGIASVEAAQNFLNPSLKNLPNPFLLPEMEKGVRRIMQAIAKKEGIAIYGDYDVDGISSSALLSLFFKELGAAVRVHIPDRIKEGYGLQKTVLEKLKNEGIGLVITADCGTKSFEALSRAKEIGLDVIVTDHHECDSKRPEALAFINPHAHKEPDTSCMGKELSGCGVAFFLLMALRQKLREENFFGNGLTSERSSREGEAPMALPLEGATRAPLIEPNLKQYLDLVALATIADLVPLTGINRILVSLGLKELSETKKPGLVALKEAAGLKSPTLSCSDIGFRLGPRINAGGRISQSSLGLNLLLSENSERAQGLAKILDQCNQDRQAMQEKHLREAMAQAEKKTNGKGLVVSSKDWHPGIVGLVASRLTENFYKPSIAFSVEGELARGSARSIAGIHIVEILEKCSDLLVQFGGHRAAAGLTIKQENLEKFEAHFENVLQESTTDDHFKPTLKIDAELDLSAIDDKLIEELETLRPYGIGNREPLFAAKQIRLTDLRTVGTNHLKFKVTNGTNRFDAICFDWKEKIPSEGAAADLAFTPQWNVYQGNKTIQLKVKDIIFS